MNDKQSTYDSMMQRVAEYDDEDAFKYIFDDLYAPLCLYARRMVPPGAAEDIAQEVFVALWGKPQRHHNRDFAEGLAANWHAQPMPQLHQTPSCSQPLQFVCRSQYQH